MSKQARYYEDEFIRTLELENDAKLLGILDITLKHNKYEIPGEIQRIILYFTPFSVVSDVTHLINGIENYPMNAPKLEIIEDIFVIIARPREVLHRVANILHYQVEQTIALKKQMMHPFWYYVACYSYYRVYKEKLHQRSKQLFILIRELLIYGRPLETEDDYIHDSNDTLPKKYGEFISSDTKHFACALLSHWYQKEEKALYQLAENALKELAKPLATIYDELKAKQSPILTLQLNKDCVYTEDGKPIKSQRDAMKDVLPDILSWYQGKPWITFSQEHQVKHFFESMGISEWNRVTKVARKRGSGKLRKSEVMMMFYRLIAESINFDFQNSMLKLYELNRSNLGLDMPAYNPLCKLVSPPIKTISRAAYKVKQDYKLKEDKPEEGSVLDWVRCAVIVESDHEMKSFFDLLCEKYSGYMVRIKNKFSPDVDAHYGYRVCMVNMLWINKENPKLRMIVEVQLILHSYLPIRSKMHLFYKIIRSKNWRAMADDFAKFSDI